MRLLKLSIFVASLFLFSFASHDAFSAPPAIESEGQVADILKKLSSPPDGAYAESASIADDMTVRSVRTLTTAFNNAAPPLKSVIAVLIAAEWRKYLESNHWRLEGRSRTQADNADSLTWDASRVRAEIARFQALSLADAAVLQQVPVSSFKQIIVPGTLTASRPTLYDFLVHHIINDYAVSHHRSRSEDRFQPDAASPLLGSLEEFLAWNPASSDLDSPVLKPLRLFQDVLRFHQNDPNPLALSDADLNRLIWAKGVLLSATGTNLRFERALRAHIERWKNCETTAFTAARLAQFLLRNPQDRANSALEAYKAATLGVALHPNSAGAKLCREIIADLEKRELFSVESEATWTTPFSKVSVRYKNVETLHLRAIAADWNSFLSPDRNRPNSLNKVEQAALFKKKFVKQWSVPLPKSEYAVRSHEFDAPSNLAPGFYFIIASKNADFSPAENATEFFPVWVSNIALIYNSRVSPETETSTEAELCGYVLNATTGEPIQNATVTAWSLGRLGARVKIPSVKTNAAGLYTFKKIPRQNTNNVLLLAEVPDGNRISNDVMPGLYGHKGRQTLNPNRLEIHFITDRPIYRPGQEVRFKAIVTRNNTETNKYTPVSGRKVTVAMDASNDKEIARLVLTTNLRGSISGSFVLPAGLPTGGFVLHTIGAENGRGHFQVEEYKRPNFSVAFTPSALATATATARLDAPVTITGTASAFSGAPVDSASVKWHVARRTHFPLWSRENAFYHNRSTVSIAHGTATTNASGAFSITFPATSDKTIDPERSPYFSFEITAEVTSGSGETHATTTTIPVGRVSLKADIRAENWLVENTPFHLKITTTTLGGSPQKATGRISIYSLKQPQRIQRDTHGKWRNIGVENQIKQLMAKWEEGDSVFVSSFSTNTEGETTVAARIPAGAYRVVLTTADKHGAPVTASTEISVLAPDAQHSHIKIPFALDVQKDSLQPGETLTALWRTGYTSGRALVSIEHRGKVLQRFWTTPGRTQQKITFPITETMRGGITLHVLQLREYRLFQSVETIDVPWSNKVLKISLERFNSKLTPNGRETWTLRVRRPDNKGSTAEIAATLYDASLDSFSRWGWNDLSDIFYRETRWSYRCDMDVSNAHIYSQSLLPDSRRLRVTPEKEKYGYPAWSAGYGILREEGTYYHRNGYALGGAIGRGLGGGRNLNASSASRPSLMDIAESADTVAKAPAPAPARTSDSTQPQKRPAQPTPIPRRNLNETAFFYPALISEPDGSLRIDFTAPEALTRWKLLVLAHDEYLRSGTFINETAVTSKDFMVRPNPPRFLREGDTVELSVSFINKTNAPLTGLARFNFSNAATLASADAALGNAYPERPITIPPRSSRTLSWRVRIPDGTGHLIYKAVAAAGLLSDGEEGFLPVLSRRQLITESLPLPIRRLTTNAPTRQNFRFEKLLASGADTSLSHESLTVQMVSNPAWHAVLALPYLIQDDSHQTNETLFNRLYTNALAAHIATANPKIARTFALWRDTRTTSSPLFQNADIKNILIEETPWIRDAENESTRRRSLGILFDKNRTSFEIAALSQRLNEQQDRNGLWSWCENGPPSEHITRRITAGFGKLHHLGVSIDLESALKAVKALDLRLVKRHATLEEELADIRRSSNGPARTKAIETAEIYALDPSLAHLLYARSFFLKSIPFSTKSSAAHEAFLSLASRHGEKLGIQTRAHIALALHRSALHQSSADPNSPNAPPKNTAAAAPAPTATAHAAGASKILASLRKNAMRHRELGVFWVEAPAGNRWSWWRAPTSMHALMIELFAELAPADTAFLDELQTWLLKQKQTHAWASSTDTVDAIHALLMRGADRLDSKTLASVKIGTKTIVPQNVEQGTGFYSERIAGTAVSPAMGKITVTNSAIGVAWGSVTWRYFQPLEKTTAHTATPLKLRKTLWKKIQTKNGAELIPLAKTKLTLGDTVVTRIELHSDRDMEFIHLKDQRGSGTEPVNTLSGYRWRDGVGCYESTRDAATHFFIDHLHAGTHIFEHESRARLRGNYQSGIAEVQCLYAPEFNSHSESTAIHVE
ncbi:MAG: hypothetical protein LBS59_09370 [Puniceicoccales bacterium]|jgi:hypothetical protein|nr:hypothetical protein [Puniceicoccales bacterium]